MKMKIILLSLMIGLPLSLMSQGWYFWIPKPGTTMYCFDKKEGKLYEHTLSKGDQAIQIKDFSLTYVSNFCMYYYEHSPITPTKNIKVNSKGGLVVFDIRDKKFQDMPASKLIKGYDLVHIITRHKDKERVFLRGWSEEMMVKQMKAIYELSNRIDLAGYFLWDPNSKESPKRGLMEDRRGNVATGEQQVLMSVHVVHETNTIPTKYNSINCIFVYRGNLMAWDHKDKKVFTLKERVSGIRGGVTYIGGFRAADMGTHDYIALKTPPRLNLEDLRKKEDPKEDTKEEDSSEESDDNK